MQYLLSLHMKWTYLRPQKMRLFIFILFCFGGLLCLTEALNLSANKYRFKIRNPIYQKCSGIYSPKIYYRTKRETLNSAEVTEFEKNITINEPNQSNRTALVLKFKELWPVKSWEENGLFSEGYLELMNEHWLKFPPPPPEVQVALGVFYMLLNGVGGLGNLVVIFMYFRDLTQKFKENWPVEDWRRYLFTDDYLLLINQHWLNFPPPSKDISYALSGLYVVIVIIGCTGNAIVFIMYYRCRSLRTPGNILVANLAISDFLMLAKVPIFVFNSIHLGPALGKTGCQIYGFLGGLTGCTSIATLACIALDRYWAIIRPLDGLRSMTAIRARILAMSSWVYAGFFASIPALDIGYGRYVPEGYLTSCSFDYLTDEIKPRYFIFVFFCAAWVTPFVTITFCYVNILRIVSCNRNTSNKNEHRLSTRHIKEQVKKKAEVKLAILVIAVIALFFLSWTPYAVVSLLGIFGRKDLITPTVSMVPALFCKTSACINPFVYIINHPKFRKEIRKFLFRNKNQRISGTLKNTTVHTEVPSRKDSKDLSDSDVEVIEMKDIPYHNDPNVKEMKTVSGRVAKRMHYSRDNSMKSFEDEMVPPPSWFAKPRFTKKKSFQRRSTKSVISDSDVI